MIINLCIFLFVLSIHFVLDKNKNKIYGRYFLDVPDSNRKIHLKPTYLLGGHYIFISYIIYLIISPDYILNQKIILFFTFTLIFLIGVLDDLKDLKPILKLSIILIIYLIIVFFDNNYLLKVIYFETFDKNLNFGKYSYFISSLCFLLLINAFNLIDGINGLAMMIFIIFLVFLKYYLNIDLNFFILIFYIFIFFNIYKGRYFLGNSGSLFIGAIIGLHTIKSYNLSFVEKNSAEDIFILFLVPGLDMLRLFIQRITNKENPFKADKSHLHHLLIKKYSLEKVLFIYFFVIITSSYMAFNNYLPEIIIILTVTIIYFLALFLLKKKIL